MTKLHEILAVESDLEAVAKKVIAEGLDTFTKRQQHFFARHQSWEMLDEARKNEAPADDVHFMETTVGKKLEYVENHLIKYYDTLIRKELANQLATADLIVDGQVIAPALPVTFLLGMEKRLVQVRGLYQAIPTLPPGAEWRPADDKGVGVYVVANPEVKAKTEKTIKSKVLVPATDNHPAQIEKWFEDKIIGRSTTITWAGLITPAEKSNLLERLDNLIQAMKQARQRANAQVVNKDLAIGRLLFEYVHDIK